MRQITDLLIWAGLFMVLAAVVYFIPRFASYVSSNPSSPHPSSITRRGVALNPPIAVSDEF